jgi:cell division protein FtsI (penicillin-binding protein 3)
VGRGTVMVPELTGVGAREAVSRLLAVALEPRLSGSGQVVSQKPPAGSYVEKGASVTVEMSARP